jgi:hypothetical protein
MKYDAAIHVDIIAQNTLPCVWSYGKTAGISATSLKGIATQWISPPLW